MSLTTSEMTPADIAAVTGNNGNGMFGGADGSWWIIILFLFIFAGWGNGGYGYGNGGGGIQENYVLTSDFSQLSRQLADTTSMTERKLDGIVNGLSSIGYQELQNINGVNMNIMQNGFDTRLGIQNLGTQMQQCCCDLRQQVSDVNYNIATQANGITNAVNTGFCQTNFNNQTNTRDILENQNANARAILDAINANKVEALKERIAEQNQQINALNLARSQAQQNEYLISQLKPCPTGAYLVANPNGPLNYNIQNGCGCGC